MLNIKKLLTKILEKVKSHDDSISNLNSNLSYLGIPFILRNNVIEYG